MSKNQLEKEEGKLQSPGLAAPAPIQMEEDPANEIAQIGMPEFLSTVGSLCAGRWKYDKQQ